MLLSLKIKLRFQIPSEPDSIRATFGLFLFDLIATSFAFSFHWHFKLPREVESTPMDSEYPKDMSVLTCLGYFPSNKY